MSSDEVVKYIVLSLIVGAVYFLLGYIAWNGVYSLFDLDNVPITKISAYRIWTYSGVCMLAIIALSAFKIINFDIAYLFVLGIGAYVAVQIDSWEDMWPAVSIIFTIVYNLFNIGVVVYALSES